MFKYLIATIISLFIIGCGGGGGFEDFDFINLPNKPQASQMAKITNENASQTALIAYKSITLDIIKDTLKQTTNEYNLNQTSLKPSYKITTRQCESGNIEIETNKNSNSAKVKFNNCIISGYTINGKIDYTFYNQDEYLAKFYNVTISGNEKRAYIQKANVIYFGNTPIKIENLYMDITQNNKTMKFFNFNSSNDNGFSFHGYVKPYCLDGFVYIKSNGIKQNVYDNYLNGSFIVRAQDKKITVTFDKDLIYVTLPNNVQKVYEFNKVKEEFLNNESCKVTLKASLPYRPNSNDFAKFKNDEKNIKIASAVFNAIDLNLTQDFPMLKEIDINISKGFNCNFGSVNKIDTPNQIKLEYHQCEISNNIIYDGNITFSFENNKTSLMQIDNLSITNHNKLTFIKFANITNKYDDKYKNYDINISKLYANVNGNELFNVNFSLTIDEGFIKVNGYIKPNCIGKYLYIDGNYFFNSNGININLFIFNEAQYKDEDIAPGDFLIISNDHDNNNYIIISHLSEDTSIPFNEFINQCP